jgi:hypothetical protein
LIATAKRRNAGRRGTGPGTAATLPGQEKAGFAASREAATALVVRELAGCQANRGAGGSGVMVRSGAAPAVGR